MSNTEAQRVISSSDFKDPTFKNKEDYGDAIFVDGANFSGNIFKQEVSFWNAIFKKQADFEEAIFEQQVDFDGVHFDSNVSFSFVSFEQESNFEGSIFREEADFEEAIFEQQTNFDVVHFDSNVSFRFVSFEQEASFEGAVFREEADFIAAEFNSSVNFSNVNFIKESNFQYVTLSDKLDLSVARLYDEFDLTFAQLADRMVKQNKKCKLYLDGTRGIERLNFTYDIFKLALPDTLDFEQFENYQHIYEALLKNFKTRGYVGSYERLDKEYQAFKYIKNPSFTPIIRYWNKAINALLYWWSDYGYDKLKIWRNVLILFIIFIGINYVVFSKLRDSYKIDVVEKRFDALASRKSLSKFKKFILCIFYTGFVFLGLKMSAERLNLKHYWGVVWLLFQFVVGTICLAFLFNSIIQL